MRRIKWWLREVGQRVAPQLTLALLARRSWVHEAEIAILPLLAEKSSTAIDAGANKGIYVHHLCRNYSRVIAFEPLPSLAKFLKRAALGAEIHALALSDEAGSTCLRLPIGFNELGTIEEIGESTENSALPFEQHDVMTIPLDSFEFENVGLIKIDVEGHELSVLAGAKRLLAASKPTVLVEVEERHKAGSVDAVFKFLGNLDYDGFFLDGDYFRSAHEFDVDCDQSVKSLENSI